MKLGGDISLSSSWSNPYNLWTAVVQHGRLDFIEVGPNFAHPSPEQDGFANPQPNRLFFSIFPTHFPLQSYINHVTPSYYYNY